MGRTGGLKRLATELGMAGLVRVWSQFTPPTEVRRKPSMAPSDHLQRPMNLIMPLHVPNIAARGFLAQLLFEATDEILNGLNNVGTVHFARFDIVDGNLCMFSIYDGDFTTYIRDFIASIGSVFDLLMSQVKDPPTVPVALHIDEFIEWVRVRDAFQLPEWPTDIVGQSFSTLPRDTLVALHRNPNVQFGQYRGYPGYSVAQIRHSLGIGW